MGNCLGSDSAQDTEGLEKPFRIVAIDLDGTTVLGDNERAWLDGNTEGVELREEFYPGTAEAALEYQKAGGNLVIATGRPFAGTQHVAAQLHTDKFLGLMVCGNGASVHDLKSEDPAQSIAMRETLRAGTLSTLYRILMKHNAEQQFGVPYGGPNCYMYNAPKEAGIHRFMKAAMDEKTWEHTSTFTFNHISGVQEYCNFLDDKIDQSSLNPDTIFTWCFGMKSEELTKVLQPAFEEFKVATGQTVHIAFLSMMSSETEVNCPSSCFVMSYHSQ
eukprot:SAG31_NODE_8997_length_1350_cov_1.596323_1_plen_274_part_00